MEDIQTHHRTSCKWCGQEVDEFCNEETGLWMYIQPEPLPITADVTDPKYLCRVYELIPGWGWHRKFTPAGRRWMELREIHECADMPRQRTASVDRRRK